MKNKIYNIAILGCGKVAHQHAQAINEIENAHLSAVWSRTFKSAEDFALKYNTRAYKNMNRLIEEQKIDFAIVCNPHPFHIGPTVTMANAGVHVLVEKPIASSIDDCDKMIQICKENSVKLGTVSQRRWYKPVQRIKEAIQQGKLGLPAIATVQLLGWRDKEYYDSDKWRGTWDLEGGGVMVNQAPHQLDILLWYMGDIDEVYGLWKNINHPYIEVEDTAMAIIKFKNGGIGNIFLSNSQKPGIYSKIHVHGDNGASAGVQTDGGAMFVAGMTGILEPPYNDIWTIPGEEKLLTKWKKEDSEFFSKIDPTLSFVKLQIEDFILAIEKDKEPLVTGEFGKKTVELFTAIYTSNKENKPVKFF